jgi:hypothetical protein
LQALALFATWMLATYLFEGLPRTLLRPGAAGLRMSYATVVNIGVGVIGSMWILRRAVTAGVLSGDAAGFRGGRRAGIGTTAGALLGGALFVAQQPPTLDPGVLVNGFSQVFVVSTAETLVCWSVIGATVEAALRRRTIPLAGAWAALAASVSFGLYHFAHSPPFNSVRMVLLLTAVGLITSVFFFTVRSVYGTILLHNFLALTGVLDALARVGRLAALQQAGPPLIATAVGALVLLLILHRAWLHPATAQPTPILIR